MVQRQCRTPATLGGILASAPRNKNFTHTRLFWRIPVEIGEAAGNTLHIPRQTSVQRTTAYLRLSPAYLPAFTCTRLSHIFLHLTRFPPINDGPLRDPPLREYFVGGKIRDVSGTDCHATTCCRHLPSSPRSRSLYIANSRQLFPRPSCRVFAFFSYIALAIVRRKITGSFGESFGFLALIVSTTCREAVRNSTRSFHSARPRRTRATFS